MANSLCQGKDSNGKVAPMGATTDSSGNPAGNVVARVHDIPGALETRTVTFNAADDLPADPTSNANVLADLVTLDTFTAGKKRCRITFHGESAITTYAMGAVCTLNAGDDVTAAARLTITDVTGAGTGSLDTRQRIVGLQNPVIEWDLTGTDSSVTRVDLVGLATGGTGAAGSVYISVEVW